MHSSFYTKCEWKEIDDFDFFFKYLIPKYYGKYKMLLDVCKCLILRYALLTILFLCLLELENKFLDV